MVTVRLRDMKSAVNLQGQKVACAVSSRCSACNDETRLAARACPRSSVLTRLLWQRDAALWRQSQKAWRGRHLESVRFTNRFRGIHGLLSSRKAAGQQIIPLIKPSRTSKENNMSISSELPRSGDARGNAWRFTASQNALRLNFVFYRAYR